MKISAIGTDALSCVPSVPHNKSCITLSVLFLFSSLLLVSRHDYSKVDCVFRFPCTVYSLGGNQTHHGLQRCVVLTLPFTLLRSTRPVVTNLYFIAFFFFFIFILFYLIRFDLNQFDSILFARDAQTL